MKKICLNENCRLEYTFRKKGNSGLKYCSLKCDYEQRDNLRYNKWLNGENIYRGNPSIKRAITRLHGYKCNHCFLTEWNNQSISLEVNHIDGNHENNSKKNVELICPNCHSQTSTYKGKNRGHGRHYRRIRYQQGLSY